MRFLLLAIKFRNEFLENFPSSPKPEENHFEPIFDAKKYSWKNGNLQSEFDMVVSIRMLLIH